MPLEKDISTSAGTPLKKPLILSGVAARDSILQDIVASLDEEKKRCKNTGIEYIPPGLATILVGDDPASHVYVGAKRRIAKSIGFADFHFSLAKDTKKQELLQLVGKLNDRNDVHGILVQLPLPVQINEEEVIVSIDTAKDVDGFHPLNMGETLVDYRNGVLAPCTPAGVMALLRHYQISTRGKHVVIVGRSNTVGKPLAAMMFQKGNGSKQKDFVKNNAETRLRLGGDATVTICHSTTKNLIDYTRLADIVVMAVGKQGLLRAEMVKEGVVVVDVGIHRVKINGKAKLVGDVAYHEVAKKAFAITPVPGGVGPMTIAQLMGNTMWSYLLVRSEL